MKSSKKFGLGIIFASFISNILALQVVKAASMEEKEQAKKKSIEKKELETILEQLSQRIKYLEQICRK